MTMNIEILYEKSLDMISEKMIVIALIASDFGKYASKYPKNNFALKNFELK